MALSEYVKSQCEIAEKRLIPPEKIREMAKIQQELYEGLKSYKLGDIYIGQYLDSYNNQYVTDESYTLNLPIKYKVVHISKDGVPMLMRLAPSGRPSQSKGPRLPEEYEAFRMLIQNEISMEDYKRAIKQPNHRFLPDPDQLDAVLLQEDFDPTQQQREMQKLQNEIHKYNHSILIPSRWSDGNKAIRAFFKSLNNGDKFWCSDSAFYVFRSLEKKSKYFYLTAQDVNGEEDTTDLNDWTHRRIYSAQPRSFAKEKAA